MSNLRKCLADKSKTVAYKDIQINEKLTYEEEPVQVLDRKIKRLRKKSIPLVLVKLRFHKGSEMTWEPELEMRKRYPR